jgi:hypothetical protein
MHYLLYNNILPKHAHKLLFNLLRFQLCLCSVLCTMLLAWDTS